MEECMTGLMAKFCRNLTCLKPKNHSYGLLVCVAYGTPQRVTECLQSNFSFTFGKMEAVTYAFAYFWPLHFTIAPSKNLQWKSADKHRGYLQYRS